MLLARVYRPKFFSSSNFFAVNFIHSVMIIVDVHFMRNELIGVFSFVVVVGPSSSIPHETTTRGGSALLLVFTLMLSRNY